MHVPPHHSVTVVLAALAGVVMLCGVAAAARWHRRTMAAAVNTAVSTAVSDGMRDSLTGLPTRAVLEQALDRADEAGAPFTIALIDVDGLHDLNARWGHAAGDQYLVAIADRLAGAVPTNGCLVRQGGDEFTVVSAGNDPAGMQSLITAALAGPARVAGHQVQLRASVGVAVGTSTWQVAGGRHRLPSAARHILACADAAMYSAKHCGGSQVLIYDEGRDGTPDVDGTRPLRRRRDERPYGSRKNYGRAAAESRLLLDLDDSKLQLLGGLLRNAFTGPGVQLPPPTGGGEDVWIELIDLAEHFAAVAAQHPAPSVQRAGQTVRAAMLPTPRAGHAPRTGS
ncbi:GGDEF domain-containing protein [Dactylosporangium cerinum]|uniref:GGDEF domain-containing protein n=1 Tax=Dactylosporangium cerinum TaxID=1434730 RepID=A0ABV9WF59_9ACTN